MTMTRQKGKLLTFCFSLVPGAGHMYLGFMKQGISLMTTFAALCAISAWLEIGPLLLFTPIIWFYSFFDAINKNSLDPEEFYALEDHYIWGDGWLDMEGVFRDSIKSRNSRKTLAVGMYIVAGCMLWSVLKYFVNGIFGFNWIVGAVIDKLPVLAVAGVIIWLAYRLMQSADGTEEPFFADETETDVPYPFVHPPVLHEEKAVPVQPANIPETMEAGGMREAAAREESRETVWQEPEKTSDSVQTAEKPVNEEMSADL